MEPLYTCCENGMISQVQPIDLSGLCPECKRNHRATPPAQSAVPLTKEQVKDLCKSAGYDMASIQARADFINGIRHGEAAHGITEKGGAA